jgi:hypothetical protein
MLRRDEGTPAESASAVLDYPLAHAVDWTRWSGRRLVGQDIG